MNETVNCYLRVLNDVRIQEEIDEWYEEFLEDLYELAERDFYRDHPHGETLLN